MSIPTNKTLYNKVKKEADKKYDKPSAYKSGWIVKEYKERGGEYSGKKKENEGLSRWYKEEWKDIGGKEYPVYRPTKRITKDTPLTESEISPTQLKKQIKRKQKIKGDANLPAFEKKGGNKISTSTIMGDIDFDNMNWGSFKKQFQASKKKLGVSSLEDFANHILDNPKGFRDTTKKRANFYKNVILKQGGAVETRGMKRRRQQGENDFRMYQDLARNFNGRLPQDITRHIGSYLSGIEPRRGTDDTEAMMGHTREGNVRQQSIEEMDREDRKKREKSKKARRIDFGSPFALNPFGNNDPPPPPPAGQALFGNGYDDVSSGGRHIVSHTVRPFFAMN